MKDLYVQYGCGPFSSEQWTNFDSSPTLRLQRLPVVRHFLPKSRRFFPNDVRFGDIVAGLPVDDRSVIGLYASHVLEHLSLSDCRTALKNSFRILKSGGVFRLVVPDLLGRAEMYISSAQTKSADAAHRFMTDSFLGKAEPSTSMKSRLLRAFGNSAHLWMWDYPALAKELETVGFVNIRPAKFGDAEDPKFSLVEIEARFRDPGNGINECAIQAVRPN